MSAGKRMMLIIAVMVLMIAAVPQLVFADEKDDITEKAERAVLLYMCGSDLEGSSLGTYNLRQVLSSDFSSEGKVRCIVMTGGCNKWHLDPEKELYDPSTGEAPDYLSWKKYNYIWEAMGADAPDDKVKSKMVLLDGDGLGGDEDNPKKADDELMSDPETLKAFIDYAAEYCPAEKYDLILWDHGAGPMKGFGIDSHEQYNEDESYRYMTFEEIIEAIADNKVTENGGRFDFIDFDACLMNTVELNLAVNGYTDCYVASAQTEPGMGQDYRGWMNAVGRDPDMDPYEVGKIIVDDYYKFYTGEALDLGVTDDATLAAVNTRKLKESGFFDALNQMVKIMKTQISTNQIEKRFQFYDELGSVDGVIKYSSENGVYLDFGNIVSQLCIATRELTSGSFVDGGIKVFNSYEEVARKIMSMLGNDDLVYSRATSGVAAGAKMHIDKSGTLQYDKLYPSGMYIFFPNKDAPGDTIRYYDAVKAVTDGLDGSGGKLRDEDCRAFLAGYAETMIRWSLLMEMSDAVYQLVQSGTPKYDIDYDMVKEYLKNHDIPVLDIWGYVAGHAKEWEKTTSELLNRHDGGEAAARGWLGQLIFQQADDMLSENDVSVRKVTGREKNGYRVELKHTSKRAIDTVDTLLVAELPAVKKFVDDNSWMFNFESRYGDHSRLPLNTARGSMDTGGRFFDFNDETGAAFQAYLDWYKDDGSSWDIEEKDHKVFAIMDADGKLHIVQTRPEMNGREQVRISFLSPREYDPETLYDKDAILVFEYNGNDEYDLVEFYPDTAEGTRPVSPEELGSAGESSSSGEDDGGAQYGPLDGIRTICKVYCGGFFVSVPLSTSKFTVTKDNYRSVKLVSVDVDDPRLSEDVGDTTGDGEKYYSEYVVKDVYQHEFSITDKVKAAGESDDTMFNIDLASVSDATYNGRAQGPKVTFSGRLLQENKDYTLYGMDGSRIPENVGTHEIMIYGIGDFAGKRSAEYKISPKGTSVRSVKKAKKVRKAVTVKWKMQKDKMSKSRITGYKIQFATNSKFTKNKKTVTVKGYKNTARTLKKMKGGKKYYVRIRTYKTINKKDYNSPWSSFRTVRTSK